MTEPARAYQSEYEVSKQLEKSAYEKIYASAGDFASAEIREHFLFESENRFRERLITLAKGKRVLEIGCGSGYHASLAAEAGGDVLAVDVSSAAIELAKKKHQTTIQSYKLNYAVMDVDQVSKQMGNFDLIINHEVFSSLNLQTVLPKLADLLVDGGRLISLECFGHNPLFNLNRRISVWRGRRTAWAADHIFNTADLNQAGKLFREVRVEYFHCFIFIGYATRKLLGERLSSPIVKLCRALDRSIVSNSLLGRLAFKVYVEMVK